jgi:hypothetical protein
MSQKTHYALGYSVASTQDLITYKDIESCDTLEIASNKAYSMFKKLCHTSIPSYDKQSRWTQDNINRGILRNYKERLAQYVYYTTDKKFAYRG